jgi:hypothetical protein
MICMICFYISLGRRMCSKRYMELYTVHGLVGVVYVCSCLSVFIIISCLGLVINYVELPYNSSSLGSGAQIYCPSSLFDKVLLAAILNSVLLQNHMLHLPFPELKFCVITFEIKSCVEVLYIFCDDDDDDDNDNDNDDDDNNNYYRCFYHHHHHHHQ